MAPIPLDRSTFPDLQVSSLELDRRSLADPLDLPSYLSSLTLREREALNSPPSLGPRLFRRDPLPFDPLALHSTLNARNAAPATTTETNPGAGSVPPDAFNMKGVQALFALIGVSFVLGAIWFFFWAKNGGCVWRKCDWDDYKSTVLRRKGPNGTTLSGATKSTILGGGSVVAAGYHDDDGSSVGMSEISLQKKINKQRKKNSKFDKQTAKQQTKSAQKQEAWEGGADDDVRAYRHEKPARVGGLNREADGTYHGTEYSCTEPSEYSAPRQHRRQSSSPHKKNPTTARRDFGYPDDQSTSSYTAPSDDRRPHRSSGQHQRSRQNSPTKNRAAAAAAPRQPSMPGSFAEPADFASEYLGSSESGTKSYHHPIPALNKQKGGNNGFRRGGVGGRRDSLSDSDGEDSRRF